MSVKFIRPASEMLVCGFASRRLVASVNPTSPFLQGPRLLVKPVMAEITTRKPVRGDAVKMVAAVGASLFFVISFSRPLCAAQARHEMVAAEGDLAAAAGLEIRKRGGNGVLPS